MGARRARRPPAPADGSAVRLYGVDHGVCFSTDPKLRTVLWAWRDEPIEPSELAVLSRLRAALDDALGDALGELLDPAEVAATGARLDALLDAGRFPMPSPDWPAVPWPPY